MGGDGSKGGNTTGGSTGRLIAGTKIDVPPNGMEVIAESIWAGGGATDNMVRSGADMIEETSGARTIGA